MHGGFYNFLKRVAGTEDVAYKNSILASKKKNNFCHVGDTCEGSGGLLTHLGQKRAFLETAPIKIRVSQLLHSLYSSSVGL